MIVAGLQMDLAWEDPVENFGRAEALAEVAVAGGARLLALPEMFATGFSMNTAVVPGHADAARRFLEDLARRLGVHVIGGYAELGEDLPFNACSLFDPHGRELLHYRKIHPFTLAGEHLHYAGGDAVFTEDVEGVRVTPFICYDLRFPEIFRAAAERTDLFVVIANWPDRRRDAWSCLLRARAIENQAYLLGVNRVGVASDLNHTGDSALLDPFGHALAEESDRPAVVAGDVDPKAVADARARLGFVADRRPEVYGGL